MPDHFARLDPVEAIELITAAQRCHAASTDLWRMLCDSLALDENRANGLLAVIESGAGAAQFLKELKDRRRLQSEIRNADLIQQFRLHGLPPRDTTRADIPPTKG